jgi:hypothetical protein
MKKALLWAIASFTGIFASYGQAPVLTATTNNPVAGDTFYSYTCDTIGVTSGSAGAGVTWDFSSLSVDTTDTVMFLSCPTTPYCDSFVGSNLVYFADSVYLYGITSTSGFSAIGAYTAGEYMHFSNPKSFLSLPMTYNTIYKDTAETYIPSFGLTLTITDTLTCDGYGTLMLPGNTYNNVLRVHTFETTKDSMFIGMPFVSVTTTEKYTWYMAGFHHPVLEITYDTVGSGTPYISEVKYYKMPVTTPPPTGVEDVYAASLQVYPNPAKNTVHIKFDAAQNDELSLTITDVTGRIVGVIGRDELRNGKNDVAYNVAALAAGMYIVKLQNGANSTAARFTVAR